MTSTEKELFTTPAGIVITTYNMLAMKDERRTEEGKRLMERLQKIQWGLLIFDEVQVAPANSFKEILNKVVVHCKLGLTATLVREDEKEKELVYLIGPKLYEANWMDLASKGFIAHVKCAEVLVPMEVCLSPL